ncbi:INO80 complex subunit-like protein [Emericellopsis cladophorae]|uniref:INO80 complex subunit-like protein n=1 Tax=Emericellopsis cladophorae TaxID=2686198 RepID=A0A9P9XZE8_9HYPO|nr:INO80 complex subunit-like protein [Emericellopsis cladophorae]KAI6780701.1 INO80 complex subunit-like protein [Emericellopsis cladophorae]
MSSRRTNRARDPVSSGDDSSHLDVTVKVPSHKLRQATRGAAPPRDDSFEGGQVLNQKRDRGGKKKYVVDDSSLDDDEDDEDGEVQLDDDDDEEMGEDEEDAEGEDDMDVGAEGDEDADGDMDMSTASAVPPPRSGAGTTIKISRGARPSTTRAAPDDEDDDDDELSEPVDSDMGDETLGLDAGNADEDEEEDAEGDEDAEGEEIDDVANTTAAGLDSEDVSGDEEPDLNKMTKRQRARFEEGPQDFMKLSDEVQAKKHFTAEELSMRRQEMARRRRNLSEKRNEEVKMETINKLLKKQAPKVNKKAAAAAAAAEANSEEGEHGSRNNPVFIRWTSTKSGNRVGVSNDLIEGPAGSLFGPPSSGLKRGKMVNEVA